MSSETMVSNSATRTLPREIVLPALDAIDRPKKCGFILDEGRYDLTTRNLIQNVVNISSLEDFVDDDMLSLLDEEATTDPLLISGDGESSVVEPMSFVSTTSSEADRTDAAESCLHSVEMISVILKHSGKSDPSIGNPGDCSMKGSNHTSKMEPG